MAHETDDPGLKSKISHSSLLPKFFFVPASFSVDFDRHLLRYDRVYLGQEFILGIVPQGNRSGRTHGVAQTIPLAENGIHGRFPALLGLAHFDGPVSTDRRASPAAHAPLLIHLADGTRGGDRVAGQKGDDPARRTIRLVDRLIDVLGILSQPTEENTVRRKFHRTQLHMGFLEEAVQAQCHLELIRHFPGRFRGKHRGRQNKVIRIQGKTLTQNRIENTHPQHRLPFLHNGFHLGGGLRLIADKLDIILRSLPVIILGKPVSPHIPEEDVDILRGILLLELQGILDRMTAADPGTVVPVFVPAAHTLDHHQALAIDDRFVAPGNLFFQLQLGHHPLVLPVKVFRGLVFLGADGDDGGPVFDLRGTSFRSHPGDEIADITRRLRDGGPGVDMNQLIPVDLLDQVFQVGLDIHPFQRGVNPSGVSAQLLLLLQEVDLMTLFGDGKGANHAGNTAADDERIVVHRQVKFLQGLQTTSTSHGHPEEILGLLGRFFFFLRVNPGVVLPDVGHFIIILVDPRLANGIPEQVLQGSRRAGGDDHAVDPLLPGHVGDLLGGVRRAGEELLLRVDHVGQRQGVLHDLGDVDDPADVRAAMADEDGDLRLFPGNILFLGINPFPGQVPPPVVQKLAALGAGPAGAENRLGNIQRPLEASTDKNPGPAGLQRIAGIDLAEIMFVQLDAELLRHRLHLQRRSQTDRQNHHVEFFFLDPFIRRGIPDENILRDRVLSNDGHIAANEPDPGKGLRPVDVALEILPIGTHIVMEDRALRIGVVILRQDGMLLTVGAADHGAVAVLALGHPSGADTGKPRDFMGMLQVGGAQDLAPIGTGGAQQPLEVHAGDHVGKLPVMVFLAQPGIERLKTCRQDDGPHIDLHLLGNLTEVDGVLLAHGFADPALVLLQVKAALINVCHQGNGLGEVHMNRLVL